MHGPCQQGPSRLPGIEVADIVRLVAGDFLDSSEHTAWQKKALRDILACRTSALGGHVNVCDHCGHEVPCYNSCRNRHCPKCQSLAQARWIERRKDRILPTHHFHLVFTLPAQIRPLAKKHPKQVYDLLIKAAANTLKTIAKDELHLGATPAITVILHTWTREMRFHPHVHVIISGGGLTQDGRWIATSKDFLFPVRVLSRCFRRKFLDGLSLLVEKDQISIPSSMNFEKTIRRLERKEWVVYAKRPYGGTGHVFEYLGRYTHRVAISNQRLLRLDQDGVTFLTRDGKNLTLPPGEFVRRFLLHVLPRGFKKIRHYGLLAPSAVKHRLPLARQRIEEAEADRSETIEAPDTTSDPLLEEDPLCPRCRKGRLSIRVSLHASSSRTPALSAPDTS